MILSALKKIRRWTLAQWAKQLPVPARGYSQYGEDLLIKKLLGVLPAKDEVYIEVGANQPCAISNTYWFYRQGYHGLLVEPNPELVPLLREIRPRDAVAACACGARYQVGALEIPHESVLAKIVENNLQSNLGLLMPVVPLDRLMETLGVPKKVFLLSIDAEGHEWEVLKGATETLRQTRLVVVERGPAHSQVITLLEQNAFEKKMETPSNDVFVACGEEFLSAVN